MLYSQSRYISSFVRWIARRIIVWVDTYLVVGQINRQMDYTQCKVISNLLDGQINKLIPRQKYNNILDIVPTYLVKYIMKKNLFLTIQNSMSFEKEYFFDPHKVYKFSS